MKYGILGACSGISYPHFLLFFNPEAKGPTVACMIDNRGAFEVIGHNGLEGRLDMVREAGCFGLVIHSFGV